MPITEAEKRIRAQDYLGRQAVALLQEQAAYAHEVDRLEVLVQQNAQFNHVRELLMQARADNQARLDRVNADIQTISHIRTLASLPLAQIQEEVPCSRGG